MSQWTHVAATFRVDRVLGNTTQEDIERVIGKTIPDYWEKYNEIYNNLNEEKPEWKYNLSEILENKEFQEFLDVYDAACKEKEKHPELYIPCGSEGCLDYSIWQNPDSSCMAAYTVSVFGELRDYDDVDAIREWFKRICNRLTIRQAVCNIDVEFKGTHNLSYVNRVFSETSESDTYKQYAHI